jgi:hypothetical protein
MLLNIWPSKIRFLNFPDHEIGFGMCLYTCSSQVSNQLIRNDKKTELEEKKKHPLHINSGLGFTGVLRAFAPVESTEYRSPGEISFELLR